MGHSYKMIVKFVDTEDGTAFPNCWKNWGVICVWMKHLRMLWRSWNPLWGFQAHINGMYNGGHFGGYFSTLG